MKCNYCEWRCELGEDRLGICRMYYASGGVIKERYPGKWSSYRVYRIESLPFYHYSPGSKCMTIGTAGCNLACKYCSNAFIAKEDPAAIQQIMYDISPDFLVRLAKKLGCENIVFNVNEPVVSIPSLLELSEAAKSAGIRLGCLTNAYATEEAAMLLASIFTFINISLKGLAPEFCREFLGIPGAEPVLRNIRLLAKHSHLEITTPVIDSANDHELGRMAGFIAEVDNEIPWHVFRLVPEYRMKGAIYPSIRSINSFLDSSRGVLKYVYFHNFVGSDWVNTICPSCGETVIERLSLGCGGDKLLNNNCMNGKCRSCGFTINLNNKFCAVDRMKAVT